MPPTLAGQGAVFVAQRWTAAVALADAQTLQANVDAQRQVAVAHAALSAAEAAIARLEAQLDTALHAHQQDQETITHLQQGRADAETARQTAEVRAAALERPIGDVQGQNEEYKGQLATMDADQLDYARREDELAALRQQLQDQAALIARISTRL